MKNKVLKIKRVLILLIAIVMVGLNINVIDAATFKVSKSSATLYVGDKTTVTVTASNVAGGPFSVTSSDKSVATVSGLNGEWLENNSGKVTITAKAVGTATITIKATVANLNDSSDEDTVTKKITITVKKKNTTNNNNNNNNTTKPVVKKSNDATLSSLSVSTGSLTPAFNKNTLEYNVNLPADATKIALNAKANHAKASVSGTGEKELKVGTNKFNIVCKAEDGTTKTYKINVNVDETPQVYTTYNGQKLGVVRTISADSAPATFEETKITLEGKEVTAFHSNQYNQTIVYLIDEQGNKNYYIYEDGKGITSIFKLTSLLGRNVVIFDLTEEEKVRENMIYQEVEIDGITLHGWKYEQPGYENYTHILVMNEMGEKVYYQHESHENSLQLYKEYVVEEEEVVVEEEKTFDDVYFYIACGVAGFFALTTLFMIIKHMRFKKKGIQEIKDFYERRNRNQ